MSTPAPATTTPTEPKPKKKGPDPLIYVIIFAILFFVTLGLLTWFLDVYNKQHKCLLDPNIWCSDNWTCQTQCTTDSSGVCVAPNPLGGADLPVNKCFCNPTGTTGLASCLYGPNAEGATNCINPGVDGETGTGDCICPQTIQETTINCFNNCYQSLALLAANNPEVNCCCNPNAPGLDDATKAFCQKNQVNCQS
jgi:hypothetical protein